MKQKVLCGKCSISRSMSKCAQKIRALYDVASAMQCSMQAAAAARCLSRDGGGMRRTLKSSWVNDAPCTGQVAVKICTYTKNNQMLLGALMT